VDIDDWPTTMIQGVDESMDHSGPFGIHRYTLKLNAMGGQVFAAVTAEDSITLQAVSVAESFENDQEIRLYRSDDSECLSRIEGRLKPKYTIRTSIENPAFNGNERVEVGAFVGLAIHELDLENELDHSVKQTASGSTVISNWTPPSGGGGPSIPIPAGLPTTGQKFERTFKKAEKRETKGRSAASMTTQQSVDASAYADGFITPPLWDESKVEGYIFDSLAGGLLVGTCIQPVPPVEAPPGSGPSGGGGSSTTLICTGTRQVSVTYY